jgi:hypothetical protein
MNSQRKIPGWSVRYKTDGISCLQARTGRCGTCRYRVGPRQNTNGKVRAVPPWLRPLGIAQELDNSFLTFNNIPLSPAQPLFGRAMRNWGIVHLSVAAQRRDGDGSDLMNLDRGKPQEFCGHSGRLC